MIRFQPNQAVSFLAYADSPSDAWERVSASSSARASALAAAVRHALSAHGQVEDLKAEVTPRAAGDTTLSLRVAGFLASRDVTSEQLGAAILEAVNAPSLWGEGAPSPVWLRHVCAGRNAGLYAASVAAFPVTFVPGVVLGIAAAVSPTARARIASEYRTRLGVVIDESSVVRGADRRPPPSSSSRLGQLVTLAGGEPRSSTDPGRDGQTPAAAAAAALPGLSVPPALVVGGVVVLGLLALVGVGYAARGVAQLARET